MAEVLARASDGGPRAAPAPAASDLDALSVAIGARADEADRGTRDLRADIEALREGGWLAAPLPSHHGGRGLGTTPEGARAAFDVLRALGRANLSVARLYEGHVNAVRLLALYGAPTTVADAFARVARGAMLGVWGADGPRPLTAVRDGGWVRLGGAKAFASGLGLVDLAIVTVAQEAGPRLLLVPTDDPTRADPSAWTVSGMRATHSGTYDFEGLLIPPDAVVGAPGDYLREPHFEGGVWRYCAAHLGGAEALYGATVDALRRRGRADDPHQASRIAAAAIACEGARLFIERAAERVEVGPGEPHARAAYALLARQATEDACLTVIDTVERALGVAAFDERSKVERMRRDLSLFVRQAAPDAKRMRAAAALVRHGLPDAL